MWNNRVTRRIQFCCGHRVHRHESKCRHLHGHNYVVYLTFAAHELDALGRVIDFGAIKDLFGPWIEDKWDHGFVLYRNDAEAIKAVRSLEEQKLYLLNANPTAENMALHLLHEIGPQLLGTKALRLEKVVLWETENCCAEARL